MALDLPHVANDVDKIETAAAPPAPASTTVDSVELSSAPSRPRPPSR